MRLDQEKLVDPFGSFLNCLSNRDLCSSHMCTIEPLNLSITGVQSRAKTCSELQRGGGGAVGTL